MQLWRAISRRCVTAMRRRCRRAATICSASGCSLTCAVQFGLEVVPHLEVLLDVLALKLHALRSPTFMPPVYQSRSGLSREHKGEASKVPQ